MPPITRRRAPEPAIGPEEEQRRAIETMSQAITYFEELGKKMPAEAVTREERA